MRHELKTWPNQFQEVYQGRKNFDIRLNDRKFQPMDILVHKEWSPKIHAAELDLLLSQGYMNEEAGRLAEEKGFTGRYCERLVGYIIYGGDVAIVSDLEAAHAGINTGYVVMSLCSVPKDQQTFKAG